MFILLVEKMKTIILGRFLSSFGSFDRAVPEEIFFFKSINLKIFPKLANHKQEPPMMAILVVRSARNKEILYRISHTSFLQSNSSLRLQVSDEKIS